MSGRRNPARAPRPRRDRGPYRRKSTTGQLDGWKGPDKVIGATCPYCGKQGFPTRRLAKQRASQMPDRRLREHRCDSAPDGAEPYWHLTSQSHLRTTAYREYRYQQRRDGRRDDRREAS